MTPFVAVFVRDRFTWLAYGMLAYFAYLQAALGPLMPFVREELGLNYTITGLHLSAFAVGMILAGLLGDRLAQRLGRRSLVWGGALGMAAGALLLVTGTRPAVTIVGALLMGTLGSLLLVMVQAGLADHHGELRAVALTEANVGAAVASMMAPLAIGTFQRLGLGWRWALIVPVMLVAVAALRAWHEPVPEAPGVADSAEGTGGSGQALPPLFWIYWIVLLLVVSAEWCVIFWGADFLENAVGLTKVLAATLLTLFWLAYVVGRVAGSRLARRLPAARLLLASLVVGLIVFPLLWLGAPAALNVAGLFLVGLAFANLFPLTLSVAVGTAPSQANAASARVSLGAGLAILTMPLILGGFADRVGILNAYGMVAMLLVVATAVTWLAGRLSTDPAA